MSTTTASGGGAKAGLSPPWMTMGVVAVGAVVAGLLLPQLLPGEMAIEKSRSPAEAKSKTISEYSPPTLPDMPNPQAMLFRLAAGTIVVLGLSVASVACMRRWMQSREVAGSAQRSLRLIETLPLGNRCSLHLVYLGNREVLVGVDGAGIKTIVALQKPFQDVLTETETTISPADPNSPQPAH